MNGKIGRHPDRLSGSFRGQGLILIKLPGHYELEPDFDIPLSHIQRKIVDVLELEKSKLNRSAERSIDRIEYAESNMGLEWRVRHKGSGRPFSSNFVSSKDGARRPTTSKSYNFQARRPTPEKINEAKLHRVKERFRSKMDPARPYEDIYISKKPVSVKLPFKWNSEKDSQLRPRSQQQKTIGEPVNLFDRCQRTQERYRIQQIQDARMVSPTSSPPTRPKRGRLHQTAQPRGFSLEAEQQIADRYRSNNFVEVSKVSRGTQMHLDTNTRKTQTSGSGSLDGTNPRLPQNWISIHNEHSAQYPADLRERQELRGDSKLTVQMPREDPGDNAQEEERLQATSSSETLKKTSNGKKLLKDSFEDSSEFRTSPGPFDRQANNDRKTLHVARQVSKDHEMRRGRDPAPFIGSKRRLLHQRASSEQASMSQDVSDDRTNKLDGKWAAKDQKPERQDQSKLPKATNNHHRKNNQRSEQENKARSALRTNSPNSKPVQGQVVHESQLRSRLPNKEDIFVIRPSKNQTSDASSPSEDPSPLTPVRLSARQHSMLVDSKMPDKDHPPSRPLTAQPKPAEIPPTPAKPMQHSQDTSNLKHAPSVKFQESAVWGLSQFGDGSSFGHTVTKTDRFTTKNIELQIPTRSLQVRSSDNDQNHKEQSEFGGQSKHIRMQEIQLLEPPKRTEAETIFRPIVVKIETLSKKNEVPIPQTTAPLNAQLLPKKSQNPSKLEESYLSGEDELIPSSWLCPLPIPSLTLLLLLEERWQIEQEQKPQTQQASVSEHNENIRISPRLDSNVCSSMDSPKKTRLHYLRSAMKQMREQGYEYSPPMTMTTPRPMFNMVPVPIVDQQSGANSGRIHSQGDRHPPQILVTPAAGNRQISEGSSRNSVIDQYAADPLLSRAQGGVKIQDKKMFLKRVISLKESPEMLAPPNAGPQFSFSGDSAAANSVSAARNINSAIGHASHMEVSRFQAPTHNSDQALESSGRSVRSGTGANSNRSPGSLFSVGAVGSKSSKASLFNLIRENKLVSFLGKGEKDPAGFIRPASDAYRLALRNEKHKILRKNVSLARPKLVMKAFGDFRGIVVNTSSGASMNYNEDRITVLVRAQEKFESLVQKGIQSCNYLAVYDGHGGAECADYLKDNLHVHLMRNLDTKDPTSCIKDAIKAADEEFLLRASKENKGETSGSCALGLINFGRNPSPKTRNCTS